MTSEPRQVRCACEYHDCSLLSVPGAWLCESCGLPNAVCKMLALPRPRTAAEIEQGAERRRVLVLAAEVLFWRMAYQYACGRPDEHKKDKLLDICLERAGVELTPDEKRGVLAEYDKQHRRDLRAGRKAREWRSGRGRGGRRG